MILDVRLKMDVKVCIVKLNELISSLLLLSLDHIISPQNVFSPPPSPAQSIVHYVTSSGLCVRDVQTIQFLLKACTQRGPGRVPDSSTIPLISARLLETYRCWVAGRQRQGGAAGSGNPPPSYQPWCRGIVMQSSSQLPWNHSPVIRISLSHWTRFVARALSITVLIFRRDFEGLLCRSVLPREVGFSEVKVV